MAKIFETQKEREVREAKEAQITLHEKRLKKFKSQVVAKLGKGVHLAEYYKKAIKEAGKVNGHPDIPVDDALRMVDAAVNDIKLKIKK